MDYESGGKNVCIDLARLHAPSLPGDFIPRAQLFSFLTDNVHKALTLVCAGAGFGKSTLISGWLKSSSFSYAWISLQEDHDDPRIFFTHLIAAVQQAEPEFGVGIMPQLQVSPIPPMNYLAIEFKNEFGKFTEDFVLVMDDLHLVKQSYILKFLQVLLEPPLDHLHLCILSRKEPHLRLSKLRSRNGVNEIVANQLRMTRDEIDSFLDESSSVMLDAPVRSLIRERSEGWIAGLRLFKLQLSSGRGTDGIFKMGGEIGHFFESYFMEEILGGFSDICIDSLLKISILPQFHPDLADALVGSIGENCSAPELIKRLLDENLFVVIVDDENRWYRFHHLFHELLQKELKKRYSKAERKSLHKKATDWYAENSMIDEALFHAREAGEYDVVALLVASYFHRVLDQDQDYMLENWLAYLPEDLICKIPQLYIIRMWILKDHEAFHVLPEMIEKFVNMHPDIDEELQAQISFFRGIVQFWSGAVAECIKSFEETLSMLPTYLYAGLLGETEVYHATAMQMNGRGEEVEAYLEKRLLIENSPYNYRFKLIGALIFRNILAGKLNIVFPLAHQIKQIDVELERNPFLVAWTDYILGSIYFRQNRLDDAAHYLEKASECRYIMDLVSPVDCFSIQLLVCQARGDNDAYQVVFKQFSEFIKERSTPIFRSWFFSVQTRLALQQNNLIQAEKYFRKVEVFNGDQNFLFWTEDPRITYCRLLIYRNTVDSLDEAFDLLHNYLLTAQSLHHVLLTMEIYILLAVLENKRNNDCIALNHLENAVELAEPCNAIRLFLEVGDEIKPLLKKLCKKSSLSDFIQDMLNQMQSNCKKIGNIKDSSCSTTASVPLPVCEKLTNREMDVILLLKDRLTNQEIADKLSISIATVKRHTITIYQKLGAKNRRDAVIKAARDGIITA
jgi:LuxR family maltose regulon positive regulatory protein